MAAIWNTRARRRSRIVVIVMAVIAGLLVTMSPASANHPEVSLTGSNFEIDTNANLKVDDAAPSIDWASVTEVRKPDQPSGALDDSFGQGTKEDTAVPTVVNGSIPPNKSDLLNFGVYLEETAAGRFLTVFWHRVQEPQGTTNMDFEFNQSKTPSANGKTPVRTSYPAARASSGASPTVTISGSVKHTAGIADLWKARRWPAMMSATISPWVMAR